MFGAPLTPAREYRRIIMSIAFAVFVIGAVGTALFAGVPVDAAADTNINVESLSVADAETTAEGDVTDVRLDATLGYNQSVPDAEERIIKLRVGPSEDNLQTLTFTRTESPADGTGTVDLSGSLLDAGFTAADFNPEIGATKTTDVVVQAVIEVTRANGDTTRATATDTATVTVHDGATVTVTVGGTGSLTVETAA